MTPYFTDYWYEASAGLNPKFSPPYFLQPELVFSSHKNHHLVYVLPGGKRRELTIQSWEEKG